MLLTSIFYGVATIALVVIGATADQCTKGSKEVDGKAAHASNFPEEVN